MKRLFLGVLLAALVTPPTAFAITVTLEGNNLGSGYNGYGPYQTGVGGEFTFRMSAADSGLLSGYSTAPGSQTANFVSGCSFQTFCVEGPEYIYPNATYSAELNSITRFGNVPLTRGAAWLYSQFAQGILVGLDTHNNPVAYNYTGNRWASAGLLQNAIWAFMGQEGLNIDLSNPFEAAAAAAIGLGAVESQAAVGEDGVYVLNLWDDTTTPGRRNPAQDQLIYAPQVNPNSVGVPDGGTTAMLLGIAFTGTAFISRKMRRF
jgi:hypothetical protein